VTGEPVDVRPFPVPDPVGAGIQLRAGSFEERLKRATSIAASVNKIVNELPAGAQYAVVAHAKLDGADHELQLSAFLNLGHGLSFAGTFGHTKKGGLGAEAALVLVR
jgi:hypothetical protein